MTITLAGKEYHVYSKVQETVAGAETINEGMAIAENCLKQAIIQPLLKKVPIAAIRTFDDERVNSYVQKVGDVYRIGLSFGFFKKIKTYLNLMKADERITGRVFSLPTEEERDNWFDYAFFYMIYFALLKEMYVVSNGKFDELAGDSCVFSEREAEQNSEALESMKEAEQCACLACMDWNMSFEKEYTRDKVYPMVRSLLFSLAQLYILEDQSENGIENLDAATEIINREKVGARILATNQIVREYLNGKWSKDDIEDIFEIARADSRGVMKDGDFWAA